MRCLRLTLSYDGTAYAGWQLQNEQPTLQGALERALLRLTGESIRVVASGRTDAGVHARGQVVSFRTASTLPAEVFVRALNDILPKDVAVLAAADAPEDFHAIRAAKSKRYRYVLHDGRLPDVFLRRYAWHVWRRLDEAAMARAAAPLRGRHDFSSFATLGSPRKTSIRTVSDLMVARLPSPDADVIHIEVEADGFLYNMVRSIVGTLVEVGRGARPESFPAEALAACDRRAAGPTAPPQGLILLGVTYDH